MSQALTWLAAAASPPPSSVPAHTTSTGTTGVQIATLIVAGCAVLATLIAAWLLRRTGRGQVEAAEHAATAAEQSAQAAQDAVGVNRETAAGVAARAEADALAKRYQDAAGQLGHSSAAVRLAGAYAMAHLADDWEAQRQMCVDVLCAYLRMPVPVAADEPPVRRVVQELLSSRLTALGTSPRWSECKIDLSGAHLNDLKFYSLVFSGGCNFSNVRLSGDCFLSASFQDICHLDRITVAGKLTFEPTAHPGLINLSVEELRIEPGAECVVRFHGLPSNEIVSMNKLSVAGSFELAALRTSVPPSGSIMMAYSQIEDGANVVLRTSKFGPGEEQAAPDVLAVEWTVGRAKVRLQETYLQSGRLLWRPETVDPEAHIEGPP